MKQSVLKFVLCGDKKCCPVLTVNKKSVTLKDDFGGKVKFTHEQAILLRNTLNKLNVQ